MYINGFVSLLVIAWPKLFGDNWCKKKNNLDASKQFTGNNR